MQRFRPSYEISTGLFLRLLGLVYLVAIASLWLQIDGLVGSRGILPDGFRFKPGDLTRRPPLVAPHQPRLDWQMWFAALGNYRQNPWFVAFLARLAEGSPAVLGLLEENPFPEGPPRFLRARLYDYHFTDFGERAESGAWWKREERGSYFPEVKSERLLSVLER